MLRLLLFACVTVALRHMLDKPADDSYPTTSFILS